MASASTSYAIGNNYSHFDVFINHRGPDVKKGLATHLYHCLRRHGLRAFLDIQELQVGDNLTPQIEGAIKTAYVQIAIFSPRYAESSWCLNELVQMLESGKTILPVFYEVNPSELRWTRGGDGVYTRALNIPLFILLAIPLFSFLRIPLSVPVSILLCVLLCTRNENSVYGRALRMLEQKTTFDSEANKEKPRYDSDTLEKWRNTLSVVSQISGFELNAYNGDEGQLVHDVVEQVLKKVSKNTLLNVAKYPTGLGDKVKDFETTMLSQQQSGKTTVIGIVGLGGVGKSTLAKELFNRYRSNYDRSCFLSDVRENAYRNSLNSLQSILLKDLAQTALQIKSVDEGIEKLKQHLSSPYSALIVFDDVDHISQLNALCSPVRDTIHSSSLILVTSRNKDLLRSSGIGRSFIYKQTGLNRQHSQELFCLHAFNHAYPRKGFEQLVEKFVDGCDGLPLSLQVIGALLYDEDEDLNYWEAQLLKISKILPSDIMSTLKISYDSLDKEEKQIFLDIACFFIGEDRETAIRIWEGSGWQGWLGLRNLENKCLVEVGGKNRISMHDHLRDLGRDIAKEEIPHRLWPSADNLLHSLCDQPCVRGISMVHGNGPQQSFEIPTNIRRLQLLRAEGESVESIFSVGQSPQLVWLCWYSCPFSFLPSWISVNNLRVLCIKGEILETLWQDESQAPLQLRELVIEASLLKVPKSIGKLKQLEKFTLKPKNHCDIVLETLPDEFCDLHSLKHLELKQSIEITSLPHSVGKWTNLQHIDLCGCSNLRTLPDSVGKWTNLQRIYFGEPSLDCLSFRKCSNLEMIPDSVGNWTNLQFISFFNCAKLHMLPDSVGNWTNLEIIYLYGCYNLHMLPDSVGNWTKLQSINLSGCSNLQMLPDSVGNWTNLENINLSECSNLHMLPDSVGNWTNLESINLSECSNLHMLPDSVGKWTKLESIYLSGCSNLQMLPDSVGNWTNLKSIGLRGCSNLPMLPDSVGNWTKLESIYLSGCSNLQMLPDSVGNWTNLQDISLKGCSNLQMLPDSVENWTNLQDSSLEGCSNLQMPPDSVDQDSVDQDSGWNWIRLEPIRIDRCSNFQDSDGNWTNIQSFTLAGYFNL